MILDQFIDKWLKEGKCEVAGSDNAKYQCVDLANEYFRSVLGLKIIEWTNAKDFPQKADTNWNYIKNTPNAIIKRGDVPVWDKNVGGGAGHISVCIQDGDLNSFTSIDQNWSIPLRITLEAHTYEYVDGWLRPKGGQMGENSPELKECLKQHDDLMAEIKEKDKTISSQAGELVKYKKEKKTLIDRVETTQENYEKTEELREKWHKLYQQSQKNLETCKLDNATFQGQITKMKETSLLTCSRKTLWLELIKDYLGKRDGVIDNGNSSNN